MTQQCGPVVKRASSVAGRKPACQLGFKTGISLMYRAAFAGMERLLVAVMRMTGIVSNIKSDDSDGLTTVHYATIAGAGCVLTITDAFIKHKVRLVRKAVVMTSDTLW